MEEKKRRTLAVLVDNEAGVLSQVTRLFSRKGYNIESLAVGATDNPAVSRITIEVDADDDEINLLCNQLNKLFQVLQSRYRNSSRNGFSHTPLFYRFFIHHTFLPPTSFHQGDHGTCAAHQDP